MLGNSLRNPAAPVYRLAAPKFPTHCNFLINTGKATAADIETLGETIIKKVREETTVTLEWEIKRLGINK